MVEVLLERETVEGEACEALLDNKWDEYLEREVEIQAAKDREEAEARARDAAMFGEPVEGAVALPAEINGAVVGVAAGFDPYANPYGVAEFVQPVTEPEVEVAEVVEAQVAELEAEVAEAEAEVAEAVEAVEEQLAADADQEDVEGR